MRNRIPKLNMPYYVNMKTIEAVHRALDIPMKDTRPRYDNSDVGEEIDENIVGDDY